MALCQTLPYTPTYGHCEEINKIGQSFAVLIANVLFLRCKSES
jgi:hypothetical protein